MSGIAVVLMAATTGLIVILSFVLGVFCGGKIGLPKQDEYVAEKNGVNEPEKPLSEQFFDLMNYDGRIKDE